MHIILTGATGTVGAGVLQQCLASPEITQLSILSRCALTLPDGDNTEKVKVLVHENYESYPEELLTQLKGADGCIWAQGVSQNSVKKEQYISITHDYPLAAAKAFASLSSTGKFNFVYVSGEGADNTEKSMALFGKIKGRTENDLLALPTSPPYESLRVFNVRPGYVDPPNKDRPRSISQRVFIEGLIAPGLRAMMPSQVSPVAVLARVLVDIAVGDGSPLSTEAGIEGDGRIVRNTAVRRMGGLKT